MRSMIFLCVLALVCSTLANSDDSITETRRKFGLRNAADAVAVVEKLASKLLKAAGLSNSAVAEFRKNIAEYAKKMAKTFAEGIEKLQDKVKTAIKNLQERVANSGRGVAKCLQTIEEKAAALFFFAQLKTKVCADRNLNDTMDHLNKLAVVDADGHKLARNTFAEVAKCTKINMNIIDTSRCLRKVALRAQVNTAHFTLRSGFAIGLANINLAALPAALDVCAGSGLVDAGLETGRVLLEVSACSRDAILDNFKAPGEDDSSDAALPTPAADIKSTTAASTCPPAYTTINDNVTNC